MDEPTAALSRKEIDDLFRIVERLKAKGKAILFISHKFDEVYEIADNFAVFRDGRAVGHGRLKETPQDEIVRMMVGRDVKDAFPEGDGHHRRHRARCRQILPSHRIPRHLLQAPARRDSWRLRPDRRRPLRALPVAFRHHAPASGRLTLEGKEIAIRSPHDAIRAGIVYVPEERGRHGLALPMPIYQNMSLPSLLRTSRTRLPEGGERVRACAQICRAARSARCLPFGAGRHPLRRKPAEGGDRQMAGDAAEGHHSRRADQGHRHRLQGRRPRLHQRTGGRRASPSS